MHFTLSQWPQRRRQNTTGSRTTPKPFVTDFQRNLIKDLFAPPNHPLKEVVHEWTREGVWKAFFGRWRRVLDGKIYQNDIPLLQLAGDNTKSGRRPDCSSLRGKG